MSATEYLIDTNILIYHTQGAQLTIDFINNLTAQNVFNISILTKIEFLGWDKHTPEGFEKCKQLIGLARIFSLDEDIANKAIEIKRKRNIKIADAVIASTALVNNFILITRNVTDFERVEGLTVINPFEVE